MHYERQVFVYRYRVVCGQALLFEYFSSSRNDPVGIVVHVPVQHCDEHISENGHADSRGDHDRELDNRIS